MSRKGLPLLGVLAAALGAAPGVLAFPPAFLDAELLGGQFLYRGASSSFGGQGSLAFGPALRLSERSTAFLAYNGDYKGFKDVRDVVGGGTLFQQTMDHRLSAKLSRRMSETWSLKPRLSYAREFLRETRDEPWGKGLYDYQRLGAGVESDWQRRPRGRPAALSASLDFYWTGYPNYRSLASSYGKELSSNDPGSRLLDTVSGQLGLEAVVRPSDVWSLSAAYGLSLRSFLDQKVIDDQARYGASNRRDFVNSLDLGSALSPEATLRLPRLGTEFAPSFDLGYHAEWLVSTQNHFDTDPALNTFIPRYYDYVRNAVSVGTRLERRGGGGLGVSYQFSLTDYRGRLAQNADGTYRGNKLRETSHLVSLDASWPVYKTLSAKCAARWYKTSANTGYQATYVYDYGSFDYFAGLALSL